ncbi:4-carboxy-4-hydroxy-2-oxoadipate aldolase/oxaloacetate decarboxylase [Solicola gregarius]|uniref:Putative 4-hydroxy-4-methyl-2-oxoglutarate aldolase n=1 Tax=Solicola gregarius TaxID=2908642 RepID=A0AA46TJ90_9ACTN|nr:4-carboxy-4-hydroxy-2-oxoadipate aldolase/oxaloacetate decarboxylase [Solicola gregarius]UYM06352.1 4-carboxy-4-hydroxy-2-oxoadipate aldolase/oxaloacetate decarboxylase [Solicola gregarius]
MSTIARSVLESYTRLGAATVHEAQGRTGALDSAIKPVDPRKVLVGRALTVDSRPGDNLAIQYAVTVAKPGDVLVVDAKAYTEGGAWGDLLTLSAQQHGISGLVIDGSVRDIQAIIEMGFPVFSRAISIKGTDKNQPGGVGSGIVCGGVNIATGDLIVGDADGVVAVLADRVDEVLRLAVGREQSEESTRQEILKGRTLIDILDLHERVRALGYDR